MATKRDHEKDQSRRTHDEQKKDRGDFGQDQAIRKRDETIQRKVPGTDPPEPPPAKRELSGLVVACQNELAIAAGQTDKVWPLRWWERPLMHFIDLPRTRAHLAAR